MDDLSNFNSQVSITPPHKSWSRWLVIVVAIISVLGYFVASYAFSLWPFGYLLTPIPAPIPAVTDPTSNWKTYRNEEYGFEMKYPAYWHKDECAWGSGVLIGFGEEQNLFACGTDAPSKALLDIVVVRKITTLSDSIQEQISSNLQNISVTSTSLDKVTAVRIEGTLKEPEGGWVGPPPSPGTKVTKVMSYHIDVLYVFSYSSALGSNLGEFDQILSTFRFIEVISLGEDKNNNGIWDDIEAYINNTYNNSQKTREALFQYAKSFQRFLLNVSNYEDTNQNWQNVSRAIDCLEYIKGTNEAVNIPSNLKIKFLSTKDRISAYAKAESRLVAYQLTEEVYKTDCDFDPDKMPN